MSNIGSQLINLRESHNWTKTFVAQNIGNMSMQSYANYEYGTREPDNETLINLAKFYNVSVDYLLGLTNIKSNSNWGNFSNYDLNEILNNKADTYFKDIKLTNYDKNAIKDLIINYFEYKNKGLKN